MYKPVKRFGKLNENARIWLSSLPTMKPTCVFHAW